ETSSWSTYERRSLVAAWGRCPRRQRWSGHQQGADRRKVTLRRTGGSAAALPANCDLTHHAMNPLRAARPAGADNAEKQPARLEVSSGAAGMALAQRAGP